MAEQNNGRESKELDGPIEITRICKESSNRKVKEASPTDGPSRARLLASIDKYCEQQILEHRRNQDGLERCHNTWNTNNVIDDNLAQSFRYQVGGNNQSTSHVL